MPLVFVHGRALDARMWDDQWAVFGEHYRVVRYDLRGFGRSGAPDGPYAHYRDLRAVIRHLDLDRPHVVGLSMGGGVALDYAIAHSHELRSLTLIDSAMGGWTGWSPGFVATIFLRDVAERGGVDAARAAWIGHPFFAPASERLTVAARLRAMADAYSGWHWLHTDGSEGPDPPASSRLAEVQVPTLVMVGDRDVPDLQRISDALADGIPGARKVVIPGVGHMANMEDPSAVNRTLLEFLSDLDASLGE